MKDAVRPGREAVPWRYAARTKTKTAGDTPGGFHG